MKPITISIFVLDDEQIWLDMIAELFAGDKYKIQCFSNPDDFAAAFNKKVDLVITDVRVKAGYDVFHTIKTIIAINPSCYIIVMSAYFDVQILQELIRLRVNDTIMKTHDADAWLSRLKESVNRLYDKLKNRAEIQQLLSR